jgi:hypothetical protein
VVRLPQHAVAPKFRRAVRNGAMRPGAWAPTPAGRRARGGGPRPAPAQRVGVVAHVRDRAPAVAKDDEEGEREPLPGRGPGRPGRLLGDDHLRFEGLVHDHVLDRLHPHRRRLPSLAEALADRLAALVAIRSRRREKRELVHGVGGVEVGQIVRGQIEHGAMEAPEQLSPRRLARNAIGKQQPPLERGPPDSERLGVLGRRVPRSRVLFARKLDDDEPPRTGPLPLEGLGRGPPNDVGATVRLDRRTGKLPVALGSRVVEHLHLRDDEHRHGARMPAGGAALHGGEADDGSRTRDLRLGKPGYFPFLELHLAGMAPRWLQDSPLLALHPV